MRKHLTKLTFLDSERFNKGVSFDTKNNVVYLAVKKGATYKKADIAKAVKNAGFEAINLYTYKGGKLKVEAF